MPAGAAIGGGSALGGLFGWLGAGKAADAQTAAGQAALKLGQQTLDYQKGLTAPFMGMGAAAGSAATGAIQSLASLYGLGGSGQVNTTALQNSPDYQFALAQGTAATSAAQAAGGTRFSGGALSALNTFGQGLASQQLGNYTQHLLSIAGMGNQTLGAFTSAGSAAASTAANMGQTIQGIGQSTASGIVGQTNALTGGINSALNNYLLYKGINQLGQNNNNSQSSYQSSGSPMNIQPSLPYGQGMNDRGMGYY